MANAHALSPDAVLEVLATGTFGPAEIPTHTEPVWETIGEFKVSVTTEAALDAIGLVSDADLTLTVRLYDVADGPVPGASLDITSTTSTPKRSASVSLTAGHRYQIQAQCVHGEDEVDPDLFGLVLSATPSD